MVPGTPVFGRLRLGCLILVKNYIYIYINEFHGEFRKTLYNGVLKSLTSPFFL